jgi:signal peptidase I
MQGEKPSSGMLYWLRVAVIGRRPTLTLLRVAALSAVVFVTVKFVLLPIRVTGVSMEPTYHNGSINLINRLAYIRSGPQRGDVVAIRLAGEQIMFLKRIVGLPGETVSFDHGYLCIDSIPQPEPYLKLSSDWEMPPMTLGPDEYYVVGDNRSMPWTDHVQGAAERRRIAGKIVFPGHR